MAFPLLLIPIIEGAIEGAVVVGEIAATGAEVTTVGAEVIGAGTEIVGAGTEIVGAGTEVVGATGEVVASDAVVTAEVDAAVIPEIQAGGSTFWKTAATFSKWVARQILEYALFDAGMRGAEAAIDALERQLGDPQTKELADLIHHLNDALQKMDDTIKDWLTWSDQHFASRDSFGTISVSGVELLVFEIFQTKLASLDDLRRKELVPVTTAAVSNKTLVSFQKVKAVLVKYQAGVTNVGRFISSKGQDMVAVGFNLHEADIEAAAKDLSA